MSAIIEICIVNTAVVVVVVVVVVDDDVAAITIIIIAGFISFVIGLFLPVNWRVYR